MITCLSKQHWDMPWHVAKSHANGVRQQTCHGMSQCCLLKQVIICFDAPLVGAISIILMNVCARGAKPLRGLYGWGLYPIYVATRRAWGYARLARLRRALPMQHADTPQVVGTCHGMSPNACTSGAAICACVSLCVTCHGMSADATLSLARL